MDHKSHIRFLTLSAEHKIVVVVINNFLLGFSLKIIFRKLVFAGFCTLEFDKGNVFPHTVIIDIAGICLALHPRHIDMVRPLFQCGNLLHGIAVHTFEISFLS